jgi:hypothetical protein
MTYADGSKYEGEFNDGNINGKGIMTYADQSKYEGEWNNNRRVGKGTMTYANANGDKYVGEWKNGMYNGRGELIVYHGPDYFINNDGSPKVFSISIGNFTVGKKNGEFKEYMDLEESDHKEKTWMKKYYKNSSKVKTKNKNNA